VAGIVTQRLVRGRREQLQRAAVWQAEWLCESAAQRAVSALRMDPGYRGEAWKVAADELAGEAGQTAAAAGQADITVTPLPPSPPATPSPPAAPSPSEGDAKPRWRVAIEARYPADGPWSVRRSREFTVADQETGAGR
jgi:hypothetical protein